MPKPWMAMLIAIAACGGQQSTGQEPEDRSARWWCATAADGFASHCERTLAECERRRQTTLRAPTPCVATPQVYCFRYTGKGVALRDTVALECSTEAMHCEETRGGAVEGLGQARMLGECEVMD